MTNLMTNPQTGKPYNPILIPLDGGMTVTNGIPPMDSKDAMSAYAQAQKLVDTVAPAPAPAPSITPFEAPTPEMGEELDNSFDHAPRPTPFS